METLPPEPGIARRVPGIAMLATVCFDHQHGVDTNEIDNEWAHLVLPLEFQPHKAAVT
ncbi:conserved hypothetical protein [Cupriavidus taiwanensis]|nr:conserved hypothetical protein [Cupriavidus taiwanensis]